MKIPALKKPAFHMPEVLNRSTSHVSKFLKKKFKKPARVPNVCCAHCGFFWYSEKFKKESKLPLFCIRCYKREVIKKPSFFESLRLAIRQRNARRKRNAKKQAGRGKLRIMLLFSPL